MAQNRPVNINLLKIKLPLSAFLSITHRISGILIFFIVLPVSVFIFSELTQSQDSFNNFVIMYHKNLGIKFGCVGLILIFQYHHNYTRCHGCQFARHVSDLVTLLQWRGGTAYHGYI